ncbi:MAG TPA: response regulator [bacterium]|nr:response regulator [bacterium]HQG44785.1 response regulator [bacterium]HQI49180.1 response regulator [bacterium]HQJ64847.1 response regulator [bacterium]
MREVLIVDYDPELREQAGHVLNGGVYSVTFASDGMEALRIVKAKHFDLILVDLLMPGALNGLQVLQGLQRHAPDSPLVVMSDRNGHQELETALRYGAREVLLKPVHKELMKAVADKLTGCAPLHSGADPAAAPAAGVRAEHSDAAGISAAPLETAGCKAAASANSDARTGLPSDHGAQHSATTAPQQGTTAGLIPEDFRARIFTGVPEASLKSLMSQGEYVQLQGSEEYSLDICRSMAILIKGQARCWYKGLLVRILDPGDSIGEASLFSKTAASLTLEVDGTSELLLCVFSRKVLRLFFQNLGYSHLLHFSARVVQDLLDSLEHMYEEMSQSQLAALGIGTEEPRDPLLEETMDSDHEWIC